MNTQTTTRTTIGTTVTKSAPFSTYCFECSTKIYIGDVVRVWTNKTTGEQRAYGIACSYKHSKRFFGKRKAKATTAAAKPTQAQIEKPKRRKAAAPKPAAVAAYAATPQAIEIEAPKPKPTTPKATTTTKGGRTITVDLNAMTIVIVEA